MTKCKVCGKETKASICNQCFLEEVTEAIDRGEGDPSKILKGLTVKYGRLKNLRKLPAFQKIFGPKRIRRVITTPEGVKCRLVPTYDGLVAVRPMGGIRKWKEYEEGEEVPVLTAEGSRYGELPSIEHVELPSQSTEGSRIVTYYEGDVKIAEYEHPTSLIVPRHRAKRVKRAKSRAPARGYRSPLAHERPPSPLDRE